MSKLSNANVPPTHDYGIVHPLGFCFFLTPSVVFIIFQLLQRSGSIFEHGLSGDDVAAFGGGITLGLASFVFAAIVLNSFPAVRARPEGLDVRFYLLFFSHWTFIPWEAISHKLYSDPFSRTAAPNVVILSNLLPIFYHLPTLLFGYECIWRRGFFVRRNIKGYEALLALVQQH